MADEKAPQTPAPEAVDPAQEIASLKQALSERDQKLEKLERGFQRLHRLEEERSKGGEPAQKDDEPLSLKALQNQLRQRDEAEASRTKSDSIRRSLEKQDLDAEGIEVLEAYIYQKEGANIKYKDGKAFWQDPMDQDNVKTIEDFVGGVVKAKGERFRAPVGVPAARGLKPGGGRATNQGQTMFEMSPEERAKLSPHQRDAIVRAEWQKYKQKGGA